jgi:hypothetical protein
MEVSGWLHAPTGLLLGRELGWTLVRTVRGHCVGELAPDPHPRHLAGRLFTILTELFRIYSLICEL